MLLRQIGPIAAVLAVLLTACTPADESAAGLDQCAAHPEQLVVEFGTDAEIEPVAAKLRADDRVEAVVTETKAQTFERFKVVFAGQPDLVKLARPEVFSASVWAEVRGPYRTELSDRLRTEFPEAEKVDLNRCDEANKASSRRMPTAPSRTPPTNAPVAGHAKCRVYSEQVIVYFDTDAEAAAFVSEFRPDPRVGALTTETKAQAYERFKEMFASQPEVVEMARPEALPASVWLAVAPGSDRAAFAAELKSRFGDEVNGDACGPPR